VTDQILLDARRKAEEAVADMPDGPLKIKAFEVILNALLRPLLGGSLDAESAAVAPKQRQGLPSRSSQKNDTVPSERQLIEEKRPANHSEMVAVLAFCLRESGKNQFTEEDMKKAYIRAVQRPPKVMAQAIRDAKNKFEYIEVGDERGYYRLTDHGERTVRFDLPR
jgi:hypothetical protein